MNVHSGLLLCVLICYIKSGKSLVCYHCHQTSEECINGVKRHLQTINCSESKCFVLNYETEMPGVTVLATYRGCHQMPEDELMQTVKTQKHTVRKIQFHLCNDTLCNEASKESVSLLSFFVAFLYLIYNFWS